MDEKLLVKFQIYMAVIVRFGGGIEQEKRITVEKEDYLRLPRGDLAEITLQIQNRVKYFSVENPGYVFGFTMKVEE